MYDIGKLYTATSVSDACNLRVLHPDAELLAGGSDVLVQIREGKRAGKEFINIYGLDEIRGICLNDNNDIHIGSLTSFSNITKSPIIMEHINVLGEAVNMVGGPQIRTIGTIGGNTCNGVTSADSASTLFAYDALVELTGTKGKRIVPIKNFYIKAKKVDIKPDEIQTCIIIPRENYEGYKGHYIKYAMRNALDIATTGCSVNAKLNSSKTHFEDVRIAYGVAAPIPIRAKSAEEFIKGKEITKENIEEFANIVLEDINPRTSWRASSSLRCHIAVQCAKRALINCVSQLGGSI